MDVRNGKTQVMGAKPKPSIRKIQLYYMFISSEDDEKRCISGMVKKLVITWLSYYYSVTG